jgi:hypothetical protein
MFDMRDYDMSISAKAIKKKMKDSFMWGSNYSALDSSPHYGESGAAYSKSDLKAIEKKANMKALKGKINARYAITTNHSSLRNVPTEEIMYEEGDDPSIDLFQVSSLSPGEPVAILHESKDGNYYYIQSYLCMGWVSKDSVGLTDKETFDRYEAYKWSSDPDFLVVTAKSIELGGVYFQQGSLIPLKDGSPDEGYEVEIPVKNPEGSFATLEATIPAEETGAVNIGFLPYTTTNILKSAFQWYGAPYGWGNGFRSVDCSGFANLAYRTAGILIPKNSRAIAAAEGHSKSLKGKNEAQRLKIIKKLPVGSILCINGHILIYLGVHDDTPYVIQATGGYYYNPDEEYQRILSCVLTDLSLYRNLDGGVAPTLECIVSTLTIP